MARCSLCGCPVKGKNETHEQCKQVEAAIRAYGPRINGGTDSELNADTHRVLARMFLAAPQHQTKGKRWR